MFRSLRRRPAPAPAPAPVYAVIDITAFPDRHAETCSDVAHVTLPLGPLITEMVALHTHTRHLAWLSERDCRPEDYQRLACSIIRQILAGWHHQTDGRGTLDDLLTGALPAEDDFPPNSSPLTDTDRSGICELEQSVPHPAPAPWLRCGADSR